MKGLRGILRVGRGNEAVPPVRHDQVMRLLNLHLAERDAGERELDPDNPQSPTQDFDRTHAAYWAEVRRSTQAELLAADEAVRRSDTVDWSSLLDQHGDEGRAR